jgi:hypothetical protein
VAGWCSAGSGISRGASSIASKKHYIIVRIEIYDISLYTSSCTNQNKKGRDDWSGGGSRGPPRAPQAGRAAEQSERVEAELGVSGRQLELMYGRAAETQLPSPLAPAQGPPPLRPVHGLLREAHPPSCRPFLFSSAVGTPGPGSGRAGQRLKSPRLHYLWT